MCRSHSRAVSLGPIVELGAADGLLAVLDASGLLAVTRWPVRADGLAVVADLAGPARWFLDHARVALSSGHVFGTGGSGRVRLNFATSKAILGEAILRMGRSIEQAL